jgi:hypothetical protein
MKRMKFRSTCLLVFSALALNAYAQAPVNLGTAGNFEVLAGTGITSADAGTTIKGGDVGSSPAPAITGLLPVQVIGGTLYLTAPVVAPAVTTAKGDLVTAYNDAFGRGCTLTIASGQIGSGATPPIPSLGPGVYCFTSTATLIGTLTLAGTSSDVWIFKIGSALLTATGATVAFSGGASPCNVFWQVTSSATIETGNSFAGVIMALTSITLNGGILNGRALARNGSVTISGSETIINACSGGSSTGSSIVVSPVTSSVVCASGASITKTAVVLSNGVPVADGTPVTFTITGPDAAQSGTVTTIGGIAKFTFTPSGLDSVVATISDGTLSNITSATCSGSPGGDFCTTAPPLPPTVTVLSVTSGPLKQVIFTVLAPGGLTSLVVDTATNATVAISSFDSGTILAVGVTATKIKQSLSSVVGLTVIDLCGNTTVFDPVFATITIPASKSKSHHAGEFDFRHREVARFNGIGHTEGIVFLQNDTLGVDSVVIRVNGSEFRTHLADGEAKKIDISSALYHGSNTVTIVAHGHPNSSVDLSISDGK